jgi:predicted DNA binding CopG/RHH family protein
MSKKTTPRTVPTRSPHDVLAQEAADWDARRRTPAEFEDAADAVPRAQEATAISIRMPKALLTVLKKFAAREGIGYQVLIKRWLDDRIREERDRLRRNRSQSATRERSRAPRFPLVDRDDGRGHYQGG